MVRTSPRKTNNPYANANEKLKPSSNGLTAAPDSSNDRKTDRTRWRLYDDNGTQTWEYLSTDEQVAKWPQSYADKWFLGLPIDLPDLPKPKKPLDYVDNALTFFEKLQLEPGNWATEYGGPMFLLPGLVITWYVTNTAIPETHAIEMTNYLFKRQHPEQGGWGLHIEGDSSVFGTTLNYIVLRILGASAEDPRMVRARATLHKLGGALCAPHWGKFWMSILGCAEWDVVNPIPPEFWLLPDWMPAAPWRWWIHTRQVYLPMGFLYSKKWVFPLTDLVKELREELYTQPYESINWAANRNTIAEQDNYHPKTSLLNGINWLLAKVWNPYLRTDSIKHASESWAWELIKMEDENTDYANLAPVNGALNFLVRYIVDGEGSYSVRRHRETIHEFLWVSSEGMMANGTNGAQTWDTSFAVIAVNEAGLCGSPKWRGMLQKSLEFLESQQITTEVPRINECYRQRRKGAWPFSTKTQGYTVSDTTSEAMKAVLLLQKEYGFSTLISDERLRDSIDTLLTMQNPGGGFASYEPQRGSEYLEWFNAAEVFGRIMVEYDYPECTSAVITGLTMYNKYYPDYRADEIHKAISRAIAYMKRAQYPDGSWYGSWGICFTYAAMFALEALATTGETYENSEHARKGCEFLLTHQMEDGGWGESYKSCETGVYHNHEKSQVVGTAWACIALMHAQYPDLEPIRRGLQLIASRQTSQGEWKQEAIEGVFNKSCMITYSNYKFVFPILALGMFARKYGKEAYL